MFVNWDSNLHLSDMCSISESYPFSALDNGNFGHISYMLRIRIPAVNSRVCNYIKQRKGIIMASELEKGRMYNAITFAVKVAAWALIVFTVFAVFAMFGLLLK